MAPFVSVIRAISAFGRFALRKGRRNGCCVKIFIRAAQYAQSVLGYLMRPGQNNNNNKRMRSRNSGRRGPNPLTRSYESNGPDVKIRGTAQHIAEKYLQLARDAQSSGDTIMAESLLQHAEHYFRLIAAAQQQQAAPGFPRQQNDSDVDVGDEDDDFSGLPDRFAPLSERLPAAYQTPQQQPQPYAQQPQPHFAPQAPQPFEDRPIAEMRSDPRQEREFRQDRNPRQERGGYNDRGRNRHSDNGERQRYGQQGGYERPDRDAPRDNRRYHQRAEGPTEAPTANLPSFITAPSPILRGVNGESEGEIGFNEDRNPNREHEGVGYHLSSRRRRRPRMDEELNAESRGDESVDAGNPPVEPDLI